mgnify:CR=1 FL=1
MDAIKLPKSLVEQTYDILLDAICSGELPPGERLQQDEIAARLGVSRQPVNSAISILKANNFVADTGRRGVTVAAVDAGQFRAIYEFRSAIEPFAVTLACARMPGDAERQSRDVLRRGRQAVEARDARALLNADVDFHQMIYLWSGNSVIEASMRVNWQHIRRAMAEVLRDPSAARISWDEHTRIVEALLSGDRGSAAAEMKGHIDRAAENTMRLLTSSRE